MKIQLIFTWILRLVAAGIMVMTLYLNLRPTSNLSVCLQNWVWNPGAVLEPAYLN